MASSAEAYGVHGDSGGGSNSITPLSWIQKLIFIGKIVVAILAIILFIFGAAGEAKLWTRGVSGFDEVFCIIGACTLFLFTKDFYGPIRKLIPPLPPVHILTRIVVGMHVLLVIGQVGVLQAYLVEYVGIAMLGFLGVDLLLLPVVVFDQYATIWATLYVVLTNVKLYLIWRTAFFNPDFTASRTSLGPNGLLAASLLTLPVIQLFIITSRLKRGLDLLSAYTTNMVAVFAHTLHVMDVTALYMTGSHDESAISGDSQYLYLALSIFGGVAANLYHVLLFFPTQDDATPATSNAITAALGGVGGGGGRYTAAGAGGFFDTATSSGGALRALGGRSGKRRGGGARDVASLGASEGTQDEGLVHYLMWLVFFVDLPFGSVRLVSWWVNGGILSSLAAKNLMMITAATHLLIVHSKGADAGDEANQYYAANDDQPSAARARVRKVNQ